MAAYSLALAAVQPIAGAPIMDLETTAYNNARIIEICTEIPSTGTGTAGQDVALGIASNTPISKYSLPLISEDVVGAKSFSTIGLAWSTAPTVPANFFRRVTHTGLAINRTWIWTFPRGLTVAPNTSMVLWSANVVLSTPLSCWWAIEE